MSSPNNNRMISIAKALGMMVVVLGHMPGGFTPFPFSPYTFHIPLFFFLSGMVFNPAYLRQPHTFVQRRFRSLLLPYFGYNFIFALITLGFVSWLGVSFSANRWNDPWMLFVEPFVTGHQYMLFAPGWFLCSLFVVGIGYLLLKRIMDLFPVPETLRFVLFCILAVAGMRYGKLGHTSHYFNHYLNMVVAKNFSGLFFFYLGTLFQKETVICRLHDSRMALVAFFVQVYCVKHFDANFYAAMNTYPSIPSSLITSLCGITMVMFVSLHLAQREGSSTAWLLAIGDQSLHILACHLLVFHLLNIILLVWHGESLQILSREFYYVYDAQRLWPVYLCAGIGMPTVLAVWIKRVRSGGGSSDFVPGGPGLRIPFG